MSPDISMEHEPAAPRPVEITHGSGPRPPATASDGSRWARLFLTAAASLASGFLGAYVFQRVDKSQSPAPARANQTADAAVPPARADGDRHQEINHLESQLGQVSKRMDQVREQLDAVVKTTAAPDLTTLRIKVAELTKTASDVDKLPERVDQIDTRLEHIRMSLDTLRGDIEAIQAKIGKSRATNLTAPSARVETAPPLRRDANKPVLEIKGGADAAAFARGAGLFQQGKYSEALDAFNKLELSDPDDARVWYFAALSRGFTTDVWNGATQQLVEKGVEREKSGTPKIEKIDDAFRNLTTSTGKDWLRAYRQRAKGD